MKPEIAAATGVARACAASATQQPTAAESVSVGRRQPGTTGTTGNTDTTVATRPSASNDGLADRPPPFA